MRSCSLIILSICFSALGLQAQWSSLVLYRFVNPIAFSQAAPGGSNAHSIWLGFQQDSDNKHTGQGKDDFALKSQFLNLNTGGLGLGRRIGWGLRMSRSHQHTDSRLGFSPVFGAQIIETNRLSIGTGISFGFINNSSNYNGVYVNHANDPLLQQTGYNYWELDAGIGFSARFQLPWMRVDAAFSANQLPGNFLSDQLAYYIKSYANYHAAGGILFNPLYNVWIGPRAQYKNILPRDGLASQPGGLDIGLQMLFDRQQMWFAAAYRPAAGQLTTGFGIQLIRPDTLKRSGFGLDIQGMGSYPVNVAQQGVGRYIGPTIELGLSLSFLRKSRSEQSKTDTLIWAQDFWDNDGAINAHRIRYFDENGPQGLSAGTSIVKRRVGVTYSFPDNSYLFLGEGGSVYKDSVISKLGEEWLGVDALIEGVANRVVRQAFHPDSTNVRDPENLEPLKSLSSFELTSYMTYDETAANFIAGETRYDGEIDSKRDIYDTLFVRVNYDGTDTTIGIPKGSYITNLQLAALKLHAMRKKLEYELRKNYRNEFYFLWEGQPLEDEEYTSGTPIVRIKMPRIVSNNPNQQDYYLNSITVRFERDPKYVRLEEGDEDEELFPEEETTATTKRGKKKNSKKAARPKKTKAPQPTRLPDQLPETEQEGTFEAAPEPEEQPEEQPSQDLFDDGDGGQ